VGRIRQEHAEASSTTSAATQDYATSSAATQDYATSSAATQKPTEASAQKPTEASTSQEPAEAPTTGFAS
jgi:hypothetical protein